MSPYDTIPWFDLLEEAIDRAEAADAEPDPWPASAEEPA